MIASLGGFLIGFALAGLTVPQSELILSKNGAVTMLLVGLILVIITYQKRESTKN